jgi:hypothetical protein
MILIGYFLLLGTATSPAFSLLGPYANWMDSTNGYRREGDIGGPMNLGQGYRWNVPIVTYTFDQSFIDYFGSNGVSAVEKAIGILNRLPRASSIQPTNYSLNTEGVNYEAAWRTLIDLKSVALGALIEQMGLASPTRYVFSLRKWNPTFTNSTYWAEDFWDYWVIPNYIVRRNFDPETLLVSKYVNGTRYGGFINVWPSHGAQYHDVAEYAIDPLADTFTAVADAGWAWPGIFYTGLTRDDVGGLRYLLRTNTLSYEILLSDVTLIKSPPPPLPPLPRLRPLPGQAPSPPPSPPAPPRLINGALRPGVEKITFVRHPYNARLSKSSPMTYRYTDAYFTNGFMRYQLVERTVRQPDFIFSTVDQIEGAYLPPTYIATATTNWWNSSAGSTNENRTGPGVIRPPIKISFTKVLPAVESYDWFGAYRLHRRIASFGTSTNSLITYEPKASPGQTNRSEIHLWLKNELNAQPKSFVLQFPVPIGREAALQLSTNLLDWTSLLAVTNEGVRLDWFHSGSTEKQFLRVVPQY